MVRPGDTDRPTRTSVSTISTCGLFPVEKLSGGGAVGGQRRRPGSRDRRGDTGRGRSYEERGGRNIRTGRRSPRGEWAHRGCSAAAPVRWDPGTPVPRTAPTCGLFPVEKAWRGATPSGASAAARVAAPGGGNAGRGRSEREDGREEDRGPNRALVASRRVAHHGSCRTVFRGGSSYVRPGDTVTRLGHCSQRPRPGDCSRDRGGVRTERWSPRGEWHTTAPAERYSAVALVM
jgi:hypothetical protein